MIVWRKRDLFCTLHANYITYLLGVLGASVATVALLQRGLFFSHDEKSVSR